MTDLTSALFALDSILDRGISYSRALERTYDRYNLSERDRITLRHIVASELRHHLLLTACVRDAFPRFASSDEQLLLLALGLDLLRGAKGDQSRLEERAQLIEETSKRMRLGLTADDIATLEELAQAESLVPAELRADPLANNALLFNCPSWILQNYLADYGQETTMEILKAQVSSPALFLSVNTAKVKASKFKDDPRFELYPSVSPSYPDGGSLRALEAGRASQLAEVRAGELYAQDRSWFSFLDALPIPQYGHILHVDARAGVISSSLALRSLPVKATVAAAFPEAEHVARAQALYTHLGIEKPLRDYQANVKNADKPLCEPIHSSTPMLKTLMSFDSQDLVVVTPSNSHTGQARRRPEAMATFNPDNLALLVRLEESSLLEASFFVAPKGYLAYAVPSLLKPEGEGAVSWFLTNRPGFKLVTQKTFLPRSSESGDGLYYAIIRRD